MKESKTKGKSSKMDRTAIINRIGIEFHTSNIEGGEYSYVQEAGSKEKLIKALGRTPNHFKLDIRFENKDVVVLVETKQNFVETDELQLAEYLQEERVLHYGKKIIAILANTRNDKIKVWKSVVDDKHLLKDETVIDRIGSLWNITLNRFIVNRLQQRLEVTRFLI